MQGQPSHVSSGHCVHSVGACTHTGILQLLMAELERRLYCKRIKGWSRGWAISLAKLKREGKAVALPAQGPKYREYTATSSNPSKAPLIGIPWYRAMLGQAGVMSGSGGPLDSAALFNPWEPPPAFCPAPSDVQLQERISLLARYASQNGPSFIDMMRDKQRGNPEFAFLQGGDGYAFFRWALYCQIHQLPVNQPLPGAPAMRPGEQQQQQQQQQQPAMQGQFCMPGEVEAGFQQVLDILCGSKDSIKSSQQWFMACSAHAPGLARMMAQRVVRLQEYDKQLHVIFLANDILFKM